MKGMRVLVTDAHTTAALAVVRSLGAAGCLVTAAGEERSFNLAAHSRFAYRAVEGPSAADDATAYVEWLESEVSRTGYDALIPINDTTVTVVRQRRFNLERHVRIALPPNEVLDRVLDKAVTMMIATECGVVAPFTRTFSSAHELFTSLKDLSYPCVIKSRYSCQWPGAGAVRRGALFYAHTPEDVVNIFRSGVHAPEHFIFQEMVPGRGIGVFVLADRGRPLATFAHRRVREANPTGGRASLAESIAPDDRLFGPAQRVIAALQWSGVAMVELKDPGAPHAPALMEVNGRFWGSLPLAIASGVDFPALLLQWMAGRPLPACASYRVGVRCRHLKGDLSYLAAALKGRPAGWRGEYPGRLQALAQIAPWPGRWRSYNFSVSDPQPGLREAINYLMAELGRVPLIGRIQQRTAQ
jgi:predicted ATP-grasp superfamily ATP-dependent carboligase